MPLLLVPLLVVVLLVIAFVPLSLVLRYRAGTARRLARGWVATLNLFMLALSVALFLVAAAVTTLWVPEAFRFALAGLVGGCLLGLAGLALSRWETTSGSLHYTPNRRLILIITLLVTARVVYGFWRGWQSWRAGPDDVSWLADAGVAGALAAGAVVLGYYLTYWAGVRHRVRRHRQSTRPRNGPSNARGGPRTR